MRRWRLLSYIWNTPWLLAIVILLIVAGIAFWIKEQIQESAEGDRLRRNDRNR